MEIKYKDYIYNNRKISFELNSKYIYGFLCDDSKVIDNIINIKPDYQGEIFKDDKKISSRNIYDYKSKIKVTEPINYGNLYYNKIYDILDYTLKIEKYYPKNKQKKIKDSLKIVGLSIKILERRYNEISSSEKKLLSIAIVLLSNPDIIVIKDPFKSLDLKTEKKLMLVLNKIKDQYNKIIIFVTDDVEKIYKHTDKTFIFNDKKIIGIGATKELLTDVKLLHKYDIKVPKIVEITYKAKIEKNIKLEYHNDVRDIIKDIYKHV